MHRFFFFSIIFSSVIFLVLFLLFRFFFLFLFLFVFIQCKRIEEAPVTSHLHVTLLSRTSSTSSSIEDEGRRASKQEADTYTDRTWRKGTTHVIDLAQATRDTKCWTYFVRSLSDWNFGPTFLFIFCFLLVLYFLFFFYYSSSS